MSALNICSIEQLEHARREEAGRPLRLEPLPSLPSAWNWFGQAAEQEGTQALPEDQFDDQIERAMVGTRVRFTIGHLLPES